LSSTPYKIQLETLGKDKENVKLISEKNKADKKARRYLFETKLKPNKKKVLTKADTSEEVSTTVNAESTTTVTYEENCPACNEKYEDHQPRIGLCVAIVRFGGIKHVNTMKILIKTLYAIYVHRNITSVTFFNVSFFLICILSIC